MTERLSIDHGPDRPGRAEPINPRPRLHRRPLLWIATGLALAAVTTVVLVWCPWCPVRVTDGSDVLAEDLTTVEQLILSENDRVTSGGDEWVSVAVLLPIRPVGDDSTAQPGALRMLQGAYLAQYWYNHPDGDEHEFGSERPLIRLLIADAGPDGQDWPDTVEQLVDMADPESSAHLVAVTGLRQSTKATQEAVNELAAHNIPMVSATITATSLTGSTLYRVASSNSDEAEAVITYLKTTEEWRSATAAAPFQAYLVQDKAAEDTYAEDLGNKYRQAFFANDPAHQLFDAQGNFDSRKPAAGNALASQISMICTGPRIVFFAGRGNDLETFLRHLATRPRPCADTPVTIVTGDDASTVIDQRGAERLWFGEGANIEVLYTAMASPHTWDEAGQNTVPQATIERFRNCKNCYRTLFPEDSLEDENAIMSHDAALTAMIAARNARSQQDPRPTAAALINGLATINRANPVPGASGWISFQHEAGRPDGMPYNKAVPIMQLLPDGTTRLVSLSSRLGAVPGGPG